MTSPRPLPRLALAAALALAGCHAAKAPPANTLDAMDNELVDGAAVNELGGNLADAIHFDPERARHPGAAPTPATAAAPPASGTSEDGSTCLARNRDRLAFASDWAGKLPADLPLHPRAQLTEAAGRSGECEVRAVSFTVPEEPEAVLAWYEDRAAKAGYDAGRTTRDGQVWLAGTRSDAAFTIMTAPAGRGTAVDYIWTKGG